MGGCTNQSHYVVCAIPRSGSSLLCDLLTTTGHAGAPAEYFDYPVMNRLRRRWGAETFEAYLHELLVRRTGANGVFGVKAHYGQLAEVFPDGLDEVFPRARYVYIERRDHLRQAISWARAVQTGRWSGGQAPANETPETFRRGQIDRLLVRIAERECEWESWFRAHGADPLRISYESLVGAPRESVLAVLDHLGQAVDVEVGPPALRRQADALTEDWVARYMHGEQAVSVA